ncbi:SRPBCC family protein [Dyadobacter tibetensis]|uniref:SRPBCC family protein n=1 Tax=Dyadobacter tibetensis TaxID=1211851 RepID=UPI0004B84B10|nr:SRPBCC family protein [Dyadobacter tibetensis]
MEKIEISSEINGSIDRVWECWSNPEHITHWNFASDDWHCPKAENDLRVGGKYLSRMEARDGSIGFDFEAIYDEVVPYETINYTMADGRQAFIKFDRSGSFTTVTIRFDAESQNSIEMQRAGWQAILDNFRKYVERESIDISK